MQMGFKSLSTGLWSATGTYVGIFLPTFICSTYGFKQYFNWSCIKYCSSLIEYKLFFRPATIPPADDLSDESALIKLAIPADKFSDTGESFLHTKSFTLRGLNRSSIYQAAVQARNKYGWSLLSSLCYFATFPSKNFAIIYSNFSVP